MEDINNHHVQALVSQMSALTNELIDMRVSVSNIENNVCEVSVKNGGGLPVTVKTKELLVKLYEYTKPDGVIDIKMKEQAAAQLLVCKTHQDNFAKSITDCKKEHSSQYKIGMFNKNFAPWERAGRSILWIALLGMMAASFFFNKEDRTKQNKQLQDSISMKVEKDMRMQLEKLAK